ncbi:uncharacterized protein SPPG_08392 [Spizellomyces punctatus DAOM BR117]|uniref:PXA domain-containing protein n=1 Tax=Spizellomyces punctatus (strain DAOM BR117) TaxID=645134 RepID=A0A0L0H697_SPIPD|nr:uncharacterized protein SPPG_08392 [Spizellomyces punctatus DAOM BR117]KNC96238.1 hypothetical protein SPPG_08392 [Spizellomyces punctatus DAOM BR117]|eukprot:XP_016604278.1 hypothetical protein SPPG_08392 [Spizellomyces punctatus DAOM BR117]
MPSTNRPTGTTSTSPIDAILTRVEAYPRTTVIVLCLAILAKNYTIIYRLIYHALVVVGIVVLYGWWNALFPIIFRNKGRKPVRDKRPIRALTFTQPRVWKSYMMEREKEKVVFRPQAFVENRQIQQVIDDLLFFISRDFIRSWWYSGIGPEPIFVSRVDAVVYDASVQVKQRLERIDFVHFVASRALPLLTAHVTEYRRAERLLRGHKLQRTVTESDEMDCQLARHYMNGRLHPAISANPTPTVSLEHGYLRRIIEATLPLICPANEISSRLFVIIVREILVCKVVQPALDLLADPDFWNQTIDMLTDRMLQQEQTLLHKIQEVLEKQPPLPTLDSESSLAPRMRTFDEFIKLIKRCDNLLDALRIRDMVLTEMHKKETETANCRPSDIINGVRVADTRIYINRLQVALKRVDKRISGLGGRNKNSREKAKQRERPTLAAVLHDPLLLSYFTEFMDQEGRMPYLQFWIVVNGVRNQLNEDEEHHDIPTNDEMLGERSDVDWRPISEDIHSVYTEFLAPNLKSKLAIDKELCTKMDLLISYVHWEPGAAKNHVIAALKILFEAQDQVFRIMADEDYTSFMRSTLYMKLVAHLMQDHSPRRSQDSIELEYGHNDPRRSSTEVDRAVVSPVGSEDELPDASRSVVPKKKSFINVFKKGKSKAAGEVEPILPAGHPANVPPLPPVRTDSIDNVEGELQSILDNPDNAFAGPFLRGRSKVQGRRMKVKPRSVDAMEGRRKDSETSQLVGMGEKMSGRLAGLFRRNSSGKMASGSTASSPVRSRTKSPASILSSDQSDGVRDRGRLRFTLGSDNEVSSTSEDDDPENEDVEVDFEEHEDDLVGSTLSTSTDIQSRTHDTTDDPTLSVLSRHPKIPVSLPLVLGSPKALKDLSDRIERLTHEENEVARQIAQAETEAWPPDRLRELELMKLGLGALLSEARGEKTKMEETEIREFITPERAKAEIVDTRIVSRDGKEYAAYIIQVTLLNAPDMREPTTGSEAKSRSWTILRRYSEFFTLHQTLRSKFPIVQRLDFPSKVLKGIMKLKKDFVENRRVALDDYLQSIMKYTDICQSSELRRFICHEHVAKLLTVRSSILSDRRPKRSLLKNLLQNADESTDAAHRDPQRNDGAPLSSPSIFPSEGNDAGFRSGLLARPPSKSEPSISPTINSSAYSPAPSSTTGEVLPAASTTDAIFDLFIELFELREKNNWFRRQAVGLVLQQLFGGTVERKVTENLRWMVSEDNIAFYLTHLRETFWPNAASFYSPPVSSPSKQDRTPANKLRTKTAAQSKLSSLLPELLGGMVGRKNARKGANRLWAVFQNRRLNQQLAYSLLDEVWGIVFPEIEGVVGERR